MWEWLSLIKHPVRTLAARRSIDWDSFRRVRGYLSNQHGRIAGVWACAVLSAICFVGQVLVIGELGELLFTPKHSLHSGSLSVTSHHYAYEIARAKIYQ